MEHSFEFNNNLLLAEFAQKLKPVNSLPSFEKVPKLGKYITLYLTKTNCVKQKGASTPLIKESLQFWTD